MWHLLGASEVSANLYCNSRTSVLGRLRDYLRLLMKRSVGVIRSVRGLYSKKRGSIQPSGWTEMGTLTDSQGHKAALRMHIVASRGT